MNIVKRFTIGAVLLLLIFFFVPIRRASAAVTCGWEGNRYCMYGESDANVQNTNVTMQCTANCYGGTGASSTPVTSSNPTEAQSGTGVCVPFQPPRSDIDAMISDMVEQVSVPGLCDRQGDEQLVYQNGSFGFLSSSTGTFTPFLERPGCLSIIIGTTSTYSISIGSQCSATQQVGLTESLDVIADPWIPDPEGDGMEPGEVITTIQITPETRPEDQPVGAVFEYCQGTTGIQTAIGCVSANPQSLLTTLVNVGIGLGGGIAFLLILLGGFRVIISRGNPEQMEGGKELVSSAVAGLFLIIFSVFILRFIGFDILQLPGFGG